MRLLQHSNVQYTSLTGKLRPGRGALVVTSKLLTAAFFLAVVSITSLHLYKVRSGRRFEPATLNAEPGEASLGLVRGPKITIPHIPSAFKTVGLIFYGRRSRVEILNCYLKVNSSKTDFSTLRSEPDSQCLAESG